jgi:hypothetical protein
MALEGKSSEEIAELEEALLARVRGAGGSCGNKSLREALGWPEELYWEVRARVLDGGRLVTGRGHGGSVRLVDPETGAAADPGGGGHPAPRGAATPEADLYEPMRKVLADEWVRDKRRFRNCLVEVTASQGRRNTGGKWSRPDMTVVGLTTFTFIPGQHLDVLTFEVKPSNALDTTAVYEALSHRRAATHSYVVLHVPGQPTNDQQAQLDMIADEARRHGIGMIVAGDAAKYETWDERVEAVRAEPDPAGMNEFISTQLSEGSQQEIIRWLR